MDKLINATNRVGIAIITPYFVNVKKLNLTLFCLSIDNHIMPANAPIGVKKAPMFVPIIDAYISDWTPLSTTSLNNTLTGILFIKLQRMVETIPYKNIESPNLNALVNSFVTCVSFKESTIINIEITNGNNVHGRRFMLVNKIWPSRLIIEKKIIVC